MTTRATLGMLAITMAVTIALGLFAPQPAQANDAGRVIAGIIAGTLVYELLGDDRPSQHRGYYYEQTKSRPHSRGWSYQSERRGFWNGNRGPRQQYTPPRRQAPPRRYSPPQWRPSPRQQYQRGHQGRYNTGPRRGQQSSYSGWNWGWGVSWGGGCY